jgi:cytochrome c oxidase subunit II
MLENFPLLPERASTLAGHVDALYWYITAVTGVAFLLVTACLTYFCARYARKGAGERTPRILGSHRLELIWSITPLFFFLSFFFWGAWVYDLTLYPPADAQEVFVVGKQWMWKLQHPGGQREINELHVPVGRPIKLTMTSEDVIHSFGVPAFRFKVDVLPGRYTQTWFTATKPGRFHLFCDQYCGTLHSQMVGTIVVMEPAEYEAWLRGQVEKMTDGSLAWQGKQLFLRLQCITCHSANARARAPVLEELYRSRVPVKGGRPVIADDAYIRESILHPRAKEHEGWSPIMPTYQGQVSEEDIIKLIAYIKSLRKGETPIRTEDFPPPVGAPTTPPPSTPEGRTPP